jgi:beta-galactosidase
MGIRSLTMNKNDGKCYLNGEAIKLRGLNRHETYPYIGRAASRRLQRKDADILKYDLGCNIVRTSHYPQAPDFLDRCDEIGLLVLEEVPGWMYIGNTQWCELQKQVLRDMVIRDRNHPSILTFGVRINESPDANSFYKEMNDIAHDLDPSRLTCGVRRGNSDPATSFLEDIWTQNFVVPSSNPPNMPVITTEFCGHNLNPQSHSWNTDVIQLSQITDSRYGHAMGHDRSYSQSKWGGLLGWCAFDYASTHGNATTAEDGRYVSPHGVSDIFRLPKLAAWFYQSQRDPEHYGPMVHICNFWKSGSPTDVFVVSNCEAVELFKDDESLGKKDRGNLYANLPHPPFSWKTSFTPGELKAVGYIGGEEVATQVVHTPGTPSEVTVVADTSTLFTGGDMTRIVVSLVDGYGQVLRSRDDRVTLSATGAGDFIGEESVDIEGGQMAFYVKTRASETGTITCNAKIGEFTGSTAITVVQEEPVASPQPAVKKSGMKSENNLYRFTCFDRQLKMPPSCAPGDQLQIFDVSGKLLHSTIVKKGTSGLLFDNNAQGVRVIKINRKVNGK